MAHRIVTSTAIVLLQFLSLNLAPIQAEYFSGRITQVSEDGMTIKIKSSVRKVEKAFSIDVNGFEVTINKTKATRSDIKVKDLATISTDSRGNAKKLIIRRSEEFHPTKKKSTSVKQGVWQDLNFAMANGRSQFTGRIVGFQKNGKSIEPPKFATVSRLQVVILKQDETQTLTVAASELSRETRNDIQSCLDRFAAHTKANTEIKDIVKILFKETNGFQDRFQKDNRNRWSQKDVDALRWSWEEQFEGLYLLAAAELDAKALKYLKEKFHPAVTGSAKTKMLGDVDYVNEASMLLRAVSLPLSDVEIALIDAKAARFGAVGREGINHKEIILMWINAGVNADGRPEKLSQETRDRLLLVLQSWESSDFSPIVQEAQKFKLSSKESSLVEDYLSASLRQSELEIQKVRKRWGEIKVQSAIQQSRFREATKGMTPKQIQDYKERKKIEGLAKRLGGSDYAGARIMGQIDFLEKNGYPKFLNLGPVEHFQFQKDRKLTKDLQDKGYSEPSIQMLLKSRKSLERHGFPSTLLDF